MPAEVSPVRSTVINSASSTRRSLVNGKSTNIYAEPFHIPSPGTTRFLRRVSKEGSPRRYSTGRSGHRTPTGRVIHNFSVRTLGFTRGTDSHRCIGTHSTLQRTPPAHNIEVSFWFCFSSPDLVRDRDVFLYQLLCLLYFLAVAVILAYIHPFLRSASARGSPGSAIVTSS